MNLQPLKNLAITLAIVAVGGVLGAVGTRLVAPSVAAPLIEPGNFSPIIAGAHHSVVLFTTSTCPFCKKARALLESIPVDYYAYEIDTSKEAEELYRNLGVTQVPVLVTPNVRITGFNADIYRARTQPQSLQVRQ